MSVKPILIVCAQALFIQSAFSQCGCGGNYGAGLAGLGAPVLAAPAVAIGGSGLACGSGLGYGTGLGYGAELGIGAGLGYSGLAIEAIPINGGALSVTSSSAMAPSSLSISSENVFEGALSVAGELPFLSAVSLEGVFPSAGAGVVSYSLGNGVTAIESIIPSAAGYAPGAAAYGAGLSAIAPGVGAIAPGLGYGGISGISSRGCGCGIY